MRREVAGGMSVPASRQSRAKDPCLRNHYINSVQVGRAYPRAARVVQKIHASAITTSTPCRWGERTREPPGSCKRSMPPQPLHRLRAGGASVPASRQGRAKDPCLRNHYINSVQVGRAYPRAARVVQKIHASAITRCTYHHLDSLLHARCRLVSSLAPPDRFVACSLSARQ